MKKSISFITKNIRTSSKKHCNAQRHATNQINMSQDIIVNKSKINKKGVFATKNFEKDEVVLKWNPKIIKKTESDKLKRSEKHYFYKAGVSKYFLMQTPERYVNHSCEANTQVKNNCDVAIRNIKKGEEITSDYGKGGSIIFKCKCGSKNCRGVIN